MKGRKFSEAVLNAGPEVKHVPVKISTEAHTSVGEAMQFVELKTLTIPAAVHHPAA
jgi:hypothetical protein